MAMTRKQREERVILPGILVLLSVSYAIAISHSCSAPKHDEERGEKASPLVVSTDYSVNQPDVESQEARTFPRYTWISSRQLADFRSRVIDAKDRCSLMCYEMEINPRLWFSCLVRSWGIPSIEP